MLVLGVLGFVVIVFVRLPRLRPLGCSPWRSRMLVVMRLGMLFAAAFGVGGVVGMGGVFRGLLLVRALGVMS